MALTAHSTIGDWMKDPTGGPLIRGLFAQTGTDPELHTRPRPAAAAARHDEPGRHAAVRRRRPRPRSQRIDAVIAAAGDRIDALADVAGINDDFFFSPAGETTDAVWDRVIAINLTAPFKLMRAVLPIMGRAGRGSILNVSSEAGLRGNASGDAYTASKHGIIGVTKSAAFSCTGRRASV